LSGSLPAFFLPIATTSNKIFKSEVIGNWKCRCCEAKGEGNKQGLLSVLSAFLLHKTRDTPSMVNREVSKSFDMDNWHLLRKGEKIVTNKKAGKGFSY